MHSIECSYFSSISSVCECVPEHSSLCRPHLLRCHGGTALLWHKDFSNHIYVVGSPRSNRMVGIRLSSCPLDIIIFSVYLPSRSGATEDFRDLLGILDSTFLQFPDCVVLFLGDFNADPGSSVSPPLMNRE